MKTNKIGSLENNSPGKQIMEVRCLI